MPDMCMRSLSVAGMSRATSRSTCFSDSSASRSRMASSNPSLLPKWYFTSAEFSPERAATSCSENSTALRSTMISRAAAISRSLVFGVRA